MELVSDWCWEHIKRYERCLLGEGVLKGGVCVPDLYERSFYFTVKPGYGHNKHEPRENPAWELLYIPHTGRVEDRPVVPKEGAIDDDAVADFIPFERSQDSERDWSDCSGSISDMSSCATDQQESGAELSASECEIDSSESVLDDFMNPQPPRKGVGIPIDMFQKMMTRAENYNELVQGHVSKDGKEHEERKKRRASITEAYAKQVGMKAKCAAPELKKIFKYLARCEFSGI